MSTEASLYGLQGDAEDLYGLNAGLNKGLKIGRALKKVSKQISLKNAIKIAPMVIAGAATGGAGSAGLAVLKKGVLKTAGKALIKKVATGAGRKMLVKTAGKALLKKAGSIAQKAISQKQQNSQPVGDLTPVAPVETQVVETPIVESEAPAEVVRNEEVAPVGNLVPVQEVPAPAPTNSITTPPATDNNKMMMYAGIGVAVLGIAYLATREKEEEVKPKETK